MPTYRVGQALIYIDAKGLRDFARASPEVMQGVQATADAIAEDARNHAPVRTGTLRDSITTTRPMRAGQPGQTVRVVARVFYAKFVEFGTRNMRPRPFMRPVANSYRHEASNTPGG